MFLDEILMSTAAIVFGTAWVLLGAKAFSPSGLPVTRKTNINGLRAKLIGITCIAFGAIVIFFVVAALPLRFTYRPRLIVMVVFLLAFLGWLRFRRYRSLKKRQCVPPATP